MSAISRSLTRTRPRLAFFVAFALIAAVPTPALAQDYGQAKASRILLAEKDLAAESSGDVAAALAL